jgi:hypothetical protein
VTVGIRCDTEPDQQRESEMKLLIAASYGVHLYDTEARRGQIVFHRFGEDHYGITWTADSVFISTRTTPDLSLSAVYKCTGAFKMEKKVSLGWGTNVHQVTSAPSGRIYVAISGNDCIAEFSPKLIEQRRYFPIDSPTLGVYDTHHINSVLVDVYENWIYIMGQSNEHKRSFVCKMQLPSGVLSERININSGFPCHNIAEDSEIGIFVAYAGRPFLTNQNLQTKYERGELCLRRQPGTDLFVVDGMEPFFGRGLAVTDTSVIMGANSGNMAMTDFKQRHMESPARLMYWVARVIYRLGRAEAMPKLWRMYFRGLRTLHRSPSRIVVFDKAFTRCDIMDIGNFGDIQEVRAIEGADYGHNARPSQNMAFPSLSKTRIALDRLLRPVAIWISMSRHIASSTRGGG